MIKNTLILAIAGIFLFSCKSNKETAKAEAKKTEIQKAEVQKTDEPKLAVATAMSDDAPAETAEKVGTVEKLDTTKGELYRLSVVFFSIGSGTDNGSMKSFELLISDFAVKIGKNINYEKMAWGREGETDYCLRLNELTKEEQLNFVNQTKETLKNAKWVHIYENQQCTHKRKS